MIKDMHAIIRELREYEPRPDHFVLGGNNATKPRVLFLGERHTAIGGQVATLAYLDRIAARGDMVLLEGADRRESADLNCSLLLVFRIFRNWQWQKLGRPYDPDEAANYAESQGYPELLSITRESYGFNGLSLPYLRCAFWDDGDALKQPITYESLKTRNKSMKMAMDFWLPRSNRLVVMGGSDHLPMGEWISAQRSNRSRLPRDLHGYYRLVKEQRARPIFRRTLILSEATGSTKPIYNFLERNRIPYAQFIHRRMFTEP